MCDGSTLVSAHGRKLGARQGHARDRRQWLAQLKRISDRRRKRAALQERVRLASPWDRHEPSNRSAAVSHLDRVAALDLAKIPTRLLPELSDPD